MVKVKISRAARYCIVIENETRRRIQRRCGRIAGVIRKLSVDSVEIGDDRREKQVGGGGNRGKKALTVSIFAKLQARDEPRVRAWREILTSHFPRVAPTENRVIDMRVYPGGTSDVSIFTTEDEVL